MRNATEHPVSDQRKLFLFLCQIQNTNHHTQKTQRRIKQVSFDIDPQQSIGNRQSTISNSIVRNEKSVFGGFRNSASKNIRLNMRLLTHNTLRNNSSTAKGKGFPLRITAAEVKVDENAAPLDEQRLAFLQGIIPTLDWPALVQVRVMPLIASNQRREEHKGALLTGYIILINVFLLVLFHNYIGGQRSGYPDNTTSSDRRHGERQ